MKRYVYETFDNYTDLEGSNLNYVNANNLREAKKIINEGCEPLRELYPNFKITMIAEVKFEDYGFDM